MKKFSFRLQRLLDLARSQEELARSETAQSLGRLRMAEDAFKEARDSVREAKDDISHSLQGGSMAPGSAEFLYKWLANAESRQQELEERLIEEEKAYEKVREIMIKRRRELLSLEKAQQRSWENWEEENRREELNSLEEIANFRHLAKRRSES